MAWSIKRPAMDWMTRIRFPAEAGMILSVTNSRPAVGTTRPRIQWVPGIYCDCLLLAATSHFTSTFPVALPLTEGKMCKESFLDVPIVRLQSHWFSTRDMHIFMQIVSLCLLKKQLPFKLARIQYLILSK
jgi:hypothetical protein